MLELIRKCEWKGIFILSLILAVAVEGLIFNIKTLSSWAVHGVEKTVELPFNQQLGYRGVIVSKEQNTLTINSVGIPLERVSFHTGGNVNQLVRGRIFIKDEGNAYSWVAAAKFEVNPSGLYNAVNEYVKSRGNALGILISFDNLQTAIAVRDISFNTPLGFSFLYLRCSLIWILISSIWMILRYRIYEKKVDLSENRWRVINTGVFGLILLFFVCFFQIINPWYTNPILFDYNERGFAQYGNQEQSLLLDYPQDQRELEFHDVYSQTLDAFNKGQLNLDLPVDPNLSALPNPYDPSARAASGVQGFWDHSFYNGKIYAYYGLGPVITIYYPIYLITVIAQQFFRNYFFTYFQWITSVLTGYAAGSSLAAQ